MNQHAENAMNRYLKDIKLALNAAPKAAQKDAMGDAAEFLSNEMSSPGAEHLATSEQQTYDHFIECYGLPSQVAAEYLQAQATTPSTMSLPRFWNLLALAVMVLMITVGAFFFERYHTSPKLTPIAQVDFSSDQPPKISPFTQVDFGAGKILVEFDGTTYEWLGIDGIPVSKVTEASKRLYRVLWRKRIVEDVVEVLWGMGHKPGETVKLQLRDLQQDKEITIAAAPMTHANRRSMYGKYPVRVTIAN